MSYRQKTRYFSLFIICFLLSSFSLHINAQDGEALFKANCTSCHAIKDRVIGPALAGVSSRHAEPWLLKWIHNSQAMIKTGDADAVKLFNDNNKIVMTSFNLKDDEIKAILGYIKKAEAETANAPQ